MATDHDQIAEVATAAGALVHRRGAECSQDHSSTESVIEDFTQSHNWDLLCLVQATSPLTMAGKA